MAAMMMVQMCAHFREESLRGQRRMSTPRPPWPKVKARDYPRLAGGHLFGRLAGRLKLAAVSLSLKGKAT